MTNFTIFPNEARQTIENLSLKEKIALCADKLEESTLPGPDWKITVNWSLFVEPEDIEQAKTVEASGILSDWLNENEDEE
jgi:hypothetical protein